MLIWTVTIALLLAAAAGWLFIKRDPERYIHEQSSPINFFFRWGRFYHHLFKIGIIILFEFAIFSIYRYLLGASFIFSFSTSAVAGAILSGGKELLDKRITADDVAASLIGIVSGLLIFILFF